MKLMIAIPCMDFVSTEFLKSLVGLTSKLTKDGVDFEVRIESGTLVYLARENLANAAIREQFTHVLWLDSDMIFDSDVFERLTSNGKDFVTAVCHARRYPYKSCVFTEVPDGRPDTYPERAFEIEGCGFGCVLVSTSILRDVNLSYWCCFMPTSAFGEDLAFCKRARERGHTLWCDPSVKAGHIGHIAVWPDNITALRAKGGRDND